MGSLLVPLGLMDEATRRFGVSEQWYPALGRLPVPRKDVERLVQLLALLPKMRDIDAPARTQHALMHRGIFRDALTWLEIYGDDPDVVAHWQAHSRNDPRRRLDRRTRPTVSSIRRRVTASTADAADAAAQTRPAAGAVRAGLQTTATGCRPVIDFRRRSPIRPVVGSPQSEPAAYGQKTRTPTAQVRGRPIVGSGVRPTGTTSSNRFSTPRTRAGCA